MAVTSIWPVKGRVDKVIDYARNPEKTTENCYEELAALHTIDGVMEYAANDMKTEQRSFVTGINCREETAAEQFMETKRFWEKTDGRVCYHGFQSFKANEVMAEQAHNIGIELAKRLWGERFEVLVATHLNTGHYHNHFVINSVSFMDGYKFYNSHEDYARMRQESDRLCREFGISVIDSPGGRGKNYGEWLAEKSGKPTRRSSIRTDIDRAILQSTTSRDFIRVMESMGYAFKLSGENGQRLKYPGIKPPGAKGYFRFHKLGEEYTLDAIKERILQNIRKKVPMPEEEKPVRRYRYHGSLQTAKKLNGLHALYLRYCYELHIIVKRPASIKRVHFLLREDIARLDKIIAETRFLGKTSIRTIDELTDYRANAESKIDILSSERGKLRNKLKRVSRQGDDSAVAAIKARITAVSVELKTLRKEVSYCDGIKQRSSQVKANLELLKEEKELERNEKSGHQRSLQRRADTRPLD